MRLQSAIIYVRVSTERQADKGTSLDNQEQACLDWCFRNGIRVMQVFREEGASAKTLTRPAMQKMITYIEDHSAEINFVVVYQIDRISRNAGDYFSLGNTLGKNSIQIRDASSPMESTPANELARNINAVLAQFDNDQKSQRVRENMQRLAREGRRLHKAPYGLKNTRDAAGKPLVEVADAEVIEKISAILRMFSTGLYTKHEVVQEARRIGLTQPNGKQMVVQFLDKLLNQPLYAALEKSSLTDGEIIESQSFEGIIPQSVYFQNQEILHGANSKTRGKYRKIREDFILRSFVYCEDCGRPLTGSASTGRGGKRYPNYSCINANCPAKSVKPDELHEQFLDHLAHLKPSVGSLELMRTVIVRKWNNQQRDLHNLRNRLNAKEKILEEKMIAAVDKVVSGEISADEKNKLSAALKNKLGAVEAEKARVEKQIAAKREAIDYALNYMNNAPRLWADAAPEMKAKYQEMIFPAGLPYNLRTNKFGTTKMSALYSLNIGARGAQLVDKKPLVIPRGIEPLLPG